MPFLIADLDQGVSQRVLERPVGRRELADGLEQLGHRRLLADPAQGLGRGAPVLERWLMKELDQQGHGIPVAPQARRMNRGLADRLIAIGQGAADDERRAAG